MRRERSSGTERVRERERERESPSYHTHHSTRKRAAKCTGTAAVGHPNLKHNAPQRALSPTNRYSIMGGNQSKDVTTAIRRPSSASRRIPHSDRKGSVIGLHLLHRQTMVSPRRQQELIETINLFSQALKLAEAMHTGVRWFLPRRTVGGLRVMGVLLPDANEDEEQLLTAAESMFKVVIATTAKQPFCCVAAITRTISSVRLFETSSQATAETAAPPGTDAAAAAVDSRPAAASDTKMYWVMSSDRMDALGQLLDDTVRQIRRTTMPATDEPMGSAVRKAKKKLKLLCVEHNLRLFTGNAAMCPSGGYASPGPEDYDDDGTPDTQAQRPTAPPTPISLGPAAATPPPPSLPTFQPTTPGSDGGDIDIDMDVDDDDDHSVSGGARQWRRRSFESAIEPLPIGPSSQRLETPPLYPRPGMPWSSYPSRSPSVSPQRAAIGCPTPASKQPRGSGDSQRPTKGSLQQLRNDRGGNEQHSVSPSTTVPAQNTPPQRRHLPAHDLSFSPKGRVTLLQLVVLYFVARGPLTDGEGEHGESDDRMACRRIYTLVVNEVFAAISAGNASAGYRLVPTLLDVGEGRIAVYYECSAGFENGFEAALRLYHDIEDALEDDRDRLFAHGETDRPAPVGETKKTLAKGSNGHDRHRAASSPPPFRLPLISAGINFGTCMVMQAPEAAGPHDRHVPIVVGEAVDHAMQLAIVGGDLEVEPGGPIAPLYLDAAHEWGVVEKIAITQAVDVIPWRADDEADRSGRCGRGTAYRPQGIAWTPGGFLKARGADPPTPDRTLHRPSASTTPTTLSRSSSAASVASSTRHFEAAWCGSAAPAIAHRRDVTKCNVVHRYHSSLTSEAVTPPVAPNRGGPAAWLAVANEEEGEGQRATRHHPFGAVNDAFQQLVAGDDTKAQRLLESLGAITATATQTDPSLGVSVTNLRRLLGSLLPDASAS